MCSIGDIIRIAPDELSFSSVQSFKDIYGPGSKQRKFFLKSELFYDHGDDASIVFERDPGKHAAAAKIYRPAFSTQALRDQEHVIHLHTDTLVDQLLRLSKLSGSVDMARAAEWLTFDIIGIYANTFSMQ